MCAYPESMSSKRKCKRGHGGVCLFIRKGISKGVNVLETDSNGFIWVKLDKVYFNLEHDIFTCFVYVPPNDSH